MVTERTFAGSLPENDAGHDVTKALLDDANRQLSAMRAFVASKLGDEVEVPE